MAASCTRVAFEHVLGVQWVLLTDGGERELVNWIEGQRHRRANEFADALSRLASEPNTSIAVLSESEHQTLVGEHPDASGWSILNACSRFSDTELIKRAASRSCRIASPLP